MSLRGYWYVHFCKACLPGGSRAKMISPVPAAEDEAANGEVGRDIPQYDEEE
jgi:hypothetical protein